MADHADWREQAVEAVVPVLDPREDWRDLRRLPDRRAVAAEVVQAIESAVGALAPVEQARAWLRSDEAYEAATVMCNMVWADVGETDAGTLVSNVLRALEHAIGEDESRDRPAVERSNPKRRASRQEVAEQTRDLIVERLQELRAEARAHHLKHEAGAFEIAADEIASLPPEELTP